MGCDMAEHHVALVDEQVEVLRNDNVAQGIYLMELAAPRIAAQAQPGQFIHLQVPNFQQHVLRRPFSLHSWDGERGIARVLYQTVGSGTQALAGVAPGTRTMAIGPVGHGWTPPAGVQRALLVCGGVGVAPLTMLACQLAQAGVQVTCLVGATTEARLVGVEMLQQHGVEVVVSSDDGTVGHHGFCTDHIAGQMAAAPIDYVAICGPGPMERAAVNAVDAAVASGAHQPRCEVSMERRMACGIGACLSCVVDTVEGRKRACVDGPVFEASEVVWR